MPTNGIDQLPAPVLAKVFTLAGTQPNDILAILRTCKHWCAVAEQECTSWWDSLTLDMEKLLPQQGTAGPAWTGVLAGMQKRAGKLRSLRVTCLGRDCTYLTTLLRQAADSGAAALQHLHLNASLEASLPLNCEVIGLLQGLQSLTLELDISSAPAWQQVELADSLPMTQLPALAPLSAMTQLRDLKIDLPRYFGAVPKELLSGFVCLTRLQFLNRDDFLPERDVVVLPWNRPAAASAPLRELQLQLAFLEYPLGAAQATLGQLTRLRLEDMDFTVDNAWDEEHIAALCALEQLQCLELKDYGTPPQFLESLPRLQHLTRLHLALLPPSNNLEAGPEAEDSEDAQDRVALAAVLGCTQLRELSLGGSCLYGASDSTPHLPPGSLQQLTRLELECEGCPGHVPLPPMCELPALRSLTIDGFNDFIVLSTQLSRLQTLQELVLRRCMLFYTEEDSDVRTQLAALSQLERLDMTTSCTARPFWVATPSSLPRLRQFHAGTFETANLPTICQLAASAELLDVSGAESPAGPIGITARIQPADVELFRPLASLRTLLLPLRPASSWLGMQRQAELEVVEHFRRELPGVEVEGVEPLEPGEAGPGPGEGGWFGGAGGGMMGNEGGGSSSDEEEGDVSEGSESGDEGGDSSGSEGLSGGGELGGGSLQGEEDGGSGGCSTLR